MRAVLTPPERTALRPHWLAGAPGFEPRHRFSARNAMPRERPPQRRGCAQKGRPLRGGPRGGGPRGGAALTGASGKRIHGAIWHIGEAGAALPTVRLAGASGVG